MKFLIIAAVMASLAQGAAGQTNEATAKRGQTIQIFSWSFFDDQCRTTSIPKIRARSKPKLGTLKVGTGGIRINRVIDQRQSHCIGKSPKGAIVTYTAGSRSGAGYSLFQSSVSRWSRRICLS